MGGLPTILVVIIWTLVPGPAQVQLFQAPSAQACAETLPKIKAALEKDDTVRGYVVECIDPRSKS